MKTTEILSELHNSNFTEDQINNFRLEKNVKKVFDFLRNGWSCQEKEYKVKCYQILDFVAKNIKGFQADIAEKAKINRFPMSEKQTWCIAYAFIN